MNTVAREFIPPQRLILTPGPTCLDPRVAHALAAPLVGPLDPWFLKMLGDVENLLRKVFRTANRITFPISASGSGGIEAALQNSLEPGDECVVCVNGAFSERMAIIGERTGARVIRVNAPYGRAVDPEDVRKATKGRQIKIVGLAHGETSSGVIHGLEDFRSIADEMNALLVVDAAATLGAVPLEVDAQSIDVCFSASQQALGAAPGMAPITVNTKAEAVMRRRKAPVRSWYLDLIPTTGYWSDERAYYHTPPVSLIFALHEAVRIVLDEGLEVRWNRHLRNQQALIAGIEAMSLKLLVENPAERLVTVTGIRVPEGLGDKKVREQLLREFNIEISGGLGEMKSQIWLIGLLGHSSQKANVLLLLAAFEKVLSDQGFPVPSGAGVAAAIRNYQRAD
jgi:alanine-glyoxylate transaminase / serine-glyoxylate transaminase / serine-pyruvate transaminase